MENDEIPREDLARVAANDLMDAVPTLEAISVVCSMVDLDQDDEFRVAMLLGLIQFQTVGLLTLLGMMDTEVGILEAVRESDDATRETNRCLDTLLDQDDTGG